VNQRGETIFTRREVMTPQRPYTTSGLARALGTLAPTSPFTSNVETCWLGGLGGSVAPRIAR